MGYGADNLDLWNTAAPVWVDFVRKHKDMYRLHLNTPVALGLMGDLLWKRVLDLGCGEGFHSRIMTKKGAKVIGLEPSDLIEYALATEDKLSQGIQYYRGRAEALHEFAIGPFDLVVANMVLHNICNIEEAIRGVAGVMHKGGLFVFSILHPMSNCAGSKWRWNGKPVPDDPQPDYFNRRPIEVTWEMEGLIRPMTTLVFHRPLSDYFELLEKTGFTIEKVIEPYPTDEQVAAFPALANQRKYPNFVHVKAKLTDPQV